MKPTSLSPEFYKNLYNKIINYGFEPETEDDCDCSMEFEHENVYVELVATFDVDFVSTEYGSSYECGSLTGIDGVILTDENSNDVSDIFDYDAFKRCMKR